jgi:hypothetical protein
MRRGLALVCFLVAGCGSSSDNGGGPGPTDSGGAGDVAADVAPEAEAGAPDAGADVGYPASHPGMPRALSAGGPVMSSPKIVAVTFAGDTLIPSVNDFVAKIFAATDYWSGVTSEYGVGPIASIQTVTLNVAPASSLADSDIQSFLAGQLGAPVDAGVDSGGDDGGDASSEGGTGGVDAGPGLPPRGLLGGTEIGDLCDAFPNVFYKPADLPYLVQRMWSNAAAAASHDPCEPNGASPYFSSAPVLADTVSGSAPGFGPYTTKGVKIPVGQSKTVILDLYSDAPTGGPWTISAIDIDSTFFGQSPELSFSFDKTQGQNGDTVQMTIQVLAAGQGNVEPFWIQSDLGNTTSVWLGLVGN